VEVAEPVGAETFLYLTTDAHSFIAKVASHMRYAMNSTVRLSLDLDKAQLFDPESEQVLK